MSEVTHPSGAFSIVLPEGWMAKFNLGPVAMAALAPEDDAGFQANITVTVEAVADDADTEWWVDAPERLASALAPARVLDVQWADVGDHVALRVLLHHTPMDMAVVLEQWVLTVGGHRWFLSASVGALAYDRWADAIEASVNTVAFASTEVGP